MEGGFFSTVRCSIKRVLLFGALKVLLKDNVSNGNVTCQAKSACFPERKFTYELP